MATNRLTFTRNSLIAATLGAGIAFGTIGVLHDQYAPAEPTVPAVSYDIGAPPQEDEPGWDCATMGNEVCHALEVNAAWQAWEKSANARELGDQSTRIEYVGKSDVPVPGHMWVDGYLFRIIYPTI
jgi:hypothetical protein